MVKVMEEVDKSFSFLEPLIFYLTDLKNLNKSITYNHRGKAKSLKTHVLVFEIASFFFNFHNGTAFWLANEDENICFRFLDKKY